MIKWEVFGREQPYPTSDLFWCLPGRNENIHNKVGVDCVLPEIHNRKRSNKHSADASHTHSNHYRLISALHASVLHKALKSPPPTPPQFLTKYAAAV